MGEFVQYLGASAIADGLSRNLDEQKAPGQRDLLIRERTLCEQHKKTVIALLVAFLMNHP